MYFVSGTVLDTGDTNTRQCFPSESLYFDTEFYILMVNNSGNGIETITGDEEVGYF